MIARAIPVALLALVVLAPLVGGALDALVHAACGPLCHQDAARSLSIAGAAMPLCARCAGVLAGVALVALLAGTRALGDGRAWPWLIALGVLDRVVRPLALDASLERLALGCVLGVGLALALARSLRWARAIAPRSRALRDQARRFASRATS